MARLPAGRRLSASPCAGSTRASFWVRREEDARVKPGRGEMWDGVPGGTEAGSRLLPG